MKRYTIKDLTCDPSSHVFSKIIDGAYISMGGMGYKLPGERTHDATCQCDICDGNGLHAHDDAEAFIILQGKAVMEIDGKEYPMTTGDIIVCEAGEDHHLISDTEHPCVNLWIHAGELRHYTQR